MKNFIMLNNGIKQPLLGLGTWQLVGSRCYDAVMEALKIGYRHIDTADIYGNHHEVGEAIKDFLDQHSEISRSDIFVTSKIWRTNLKQQDVINSGNKILSQLGLVYIDQLLVHWPNHSVSISETLSAMAQLLDQGLVKSIGVSNFTQNHLKDLLQYGHKIQVNQVELHPSFNQKDLAAFCHQNDIQIVAYSPLGRNADLEDQTIINLAQKYKKTPSQIILNWHMRQNHIAIPKASSAKHLIENFDALHFDLVDEDAENINLISQQERMICPSFSEFDY